MESRRNQHRATQGSSVEQHHSVEKHLVFLRAASLFFFCLICSRALAQDSVSPLFDRVNQYASTFSELNKQFDENTAELARLNQRLEPLFQSLNETERDLQGIQGLQFEAKVRQQTAMASLPPQEQATKDILRMRLPSLTNAASLQASIAGSTRAEIFNLEQVRSQLTVAQQSTVERRLKVLNQLQSLSRQSEGLLAQQQKLLDDYLLHTDLGGTRSRIELRSARRLLMQADSNNFGAQLAAAITNMRLGEWEEAESSLDDLIEKRLPISVFARAARAELHAYQNRTRQTKSDLGAIGTNPHPAIALLRARAWAILNSQNESVKNWDQLAKSKSHQNLAWCSSALLQCSNSPTPAMAKKLLEQVRLADDLSGGQDWLAKIALALAYSATNDPAAALQHAKQAAALAIDDKKALCLEIVEQLETGQRVKWKF